MTASSPIGFVGLGDMGATLVRRMLDQGLAVVASDIDPRAVERVVAHGATPAATLAELAGRCTVVGVCVPADDHVRSVLDGPDGLLAQLASGSTVAIHSTVLPETAVWAAERAREHGVTAIEAAVTGGTALVAEGRATFLVSGDPAASEPLAPVLSACSSQQIHAGEIGQAARLKLCINLQSYGTFLAVNAAATLAQAAGLSVADLKTAMAANGQLGHMTANYMTLFDLGPEILDSPQMRNLLEGNAAITEKDLDLIAALAHELGQPTDLADLARRCTRRIYQLEDRP